MAGMFRVQRSRGALSGVLLVLLGIWGALIPFVGPYFHYAYTPDKAWHMTSGRLWLELLPGVVTLAAGVVVMLSRLRATAVLGAWLAALAGAWFAVGGLVAAQSHRLQTAGTPVGTGRRVLFEQLGFFTGLGVVIVFVAALALGRFTVVAARDSVEEDVFDLDPEPEPERHTVSTRSTLARVTPVPVFRGRRSPG